MLDLNYLYIFMVGNLSNTFGYQMAFAFSNIMGGDYSLRYVSGGFNNANSNDALYSTYYANGLANTLLDFTQRHIIDGSLNTSGTSVLSLSSAFLSRYFNGNINEIIIYNGPTIITSAQIIEVRNYLRSKWGI